MATFKKRTSTVEAMRLTPQLPPTDLHAFLGSLDNVRTVPDFRGFVISTPEGDLPVAGGDWLIKESGGRLVGTDHYSFTAGYEPVQEQSDGK